MSTMTVSVDTEFLVRVRAQVMMRDDSTGGWVPLGGGGLSWVAVKKRALQGLQLHKQQQAQAEGEEAEQPLPREDDCLVGEGCDGALRGCEGGNQQSTPHKRGDIQCSCHYEYLIVGRRISDDHDVLSCTIKPDFQYNRVMPTFHHWRTGNKKFGLTFQTAADARTFDKGITAAVDDLLNDVATETTPLQGKDGDGDVFMMLNLPLERENSGSGTPDNRSPHKSISPPLSCGSPSYRAGLRGSSPTSPPTSLPHSPPTHPPSSCNRSPVPPPPARLTPTRLMPLGSPLHNHTVIGGCELGDGDERGCLGSPSLNQQTNQRLTRSRTVYGGCGGYGHRTGRGSLRGTGLPLGDPKPPGDNVYEWLKNASEKPPLYPLGRSYSSDKDSVHDKYYMLQPGMGGIERDSVSDTYVRFEVKDQDPQYQYPNLESLANVLPSPDKSGRRGSLSSLKRQSTSLGLDESLAPFQSKEKGKKAPKKKKHKKGSGVRVRCAHCQELYIESENKRGSCSYSPDAVRQGIECVSCLACAKCLLYHCHYEDENFSEEEICTCTDTDGHLTQRWIGLSLLAVLVPCLCLYPMFTACYTCARACHVCGGKHVPV